MVDVTQIANDVSTLIGVFTATIIPAIGGLVLSINNYIKHHYHSARTDALTEKVASLEGKVMTIDKSVGDKAGEIGDVVANVPGVSDAVAAHEKQLKDLQSSVVSLTAELNKIKGLIPAN